MSEFGYAGKSFSVSLDNGVVFHNTYAADGTALHYETVAGPNTGAAEDVELHAVEVAPGIFMVSWTESSGMTVTHGMNLFNKTVHAFWTYQTQDGRVGELHSGTFEEI